MIIYALIIIASLFFLAWNLISNRKLHFVASLVTTILFIVAVAFAIGNYGYHFGMHQVNEPIRYQRVYSLLPMKSLKMISYQPMGNNHNSQIVLYKNASNRVIHTTPDVNVHNQIVRTSSRKQASVKTNASKWVYRNSWDRAWFRLAKKPSVYKVTHVFYVPRSWKVLTSKQTLAFKQIVKNRSLQAKHQMNSSKIKLQMKQQASDYVKSKVASAMRNDPKMSVAKKKYVIHQAIKEFKEQIQLKMEKQVASEALQTAETIH